MTRLASDINVAAVRLLLALVTGAVATSLLPLIAEPSLPALKATVYALAILFALLLFHPRSSALLLSAWCLSATLLLGALLVIDPVTRIIIPHLGTMLLAFFVLAATFVILARYLSGAAAAALFALLCLAPVWAAPLVEALNNPGWLSRFVIGVSPLTVIASSLELDYLRSEWFYANSAFGSMRYTYPGTAVALAVLAILPLAAVVFEGAAPAKHKEAHS